jgi:outer membrane protein assembly factor BamA
MSSDIHDISEGRHASCDGPGMIQRTGIWLLALCAIAAHGGAIDASAEVAPLPSSLTLESVVVTPPGGGEETAVRLFLDLRPGDPLDAETLAEARDALESSGYFRHVSLYTSRGVQPGAVVLHVEADLDRRLRFETGFGYEPITSWYLNLVGVRWNNPLRRADHLRLGVRLGLRTAGVNASGAQPALFGSHLDLLGELANENEQWLAYEGEDLRRQEIDRGLARLGLRWRLPADVDLVVWGGVSSALPDSVLRGAEGVEDEPAGRLVPRTDEREIYRDLKLVLTLDRRSRKTPWRSGQWYGLQVRTSSIRGGAAFWRADLDGRLFAPLGSKGALALRARGIYTDPATPYHLRPIFGGFDTIRGFRDASLSGPNGARALWQANAELRFALTPRPGPDARVLGVVFGELGDHWNESGEHQGVSVGVGYGLRVRVPWIQIFGIDVGIPLTPTKTGDPFWIHATLGMSF